MRLIRDRYFFVLVLALFIGCQSNAEEYKSPGYTKYVAEIISSFAKQMKQEFGLDCEGSGRSMPHDVQEISLMFVACQRATVEQARELEVKVTERFVQMINAHEQIRPFLREYPFPSKRANVEIYFLKQNNTRYNDGSVVFVYQVNNRIYYRAENPLNHYVYKPIKDEPYKEALSIVLNSSTNNPSSPSKDL